MISFLLAAAVAAAPPQGPSIAKIKGSACFQMQLAVLRAEGNVALRDSVLDTMGELITIDKARVAMLPDSEARKGLVATLQTRSAMLINLRDAAEYQDRNLRDAYELSKLA